MAQSPGNGKDLLVTTQEHSVLFELFEDRIHLVAVKVKSWPVEGAAEAMVELASTGMTRQLAIVAQPKYAQLQ